MNISNLSKHALLSWCLLFYVQIVWGQEAGTMTRVSGKATVTSLENATREAKANDPVSVGEIVTTDTGAEVLIRFKDNSTMIVRSASKLKISQFRFEKKSHRHFANQSFVWHVACCQWPNCKGATVKRQI